MSTLRSEITSSAPYDVEAIRKDFPFFESGIAYLDSTSTTQRPRQVLDAMLEYFTRYNANVHRGIYRTSMEASARYEETRRKVRDLINAKSVKEIIYTRNLTEGVNLVASTWGRANVRAGDLIVLTIMEHHSNIVPWQILAEEKGARIEYVDIDDSGQLRLDQFYALVERGPKMVAFAQVSNTLGTINPYREMTAAAKAAGATVLIDGAQGVPHIGIDVRETGCDFYAFSGHKMLGPTGIGILYGRRELLEAMPPYQGGGGQIRSVFLDHTDYAELPDKFEAGTPAIAEVIGLGAAVDYLQGVGFDAIHSYEERLSDYAFEALSEVDGLRVIGPPTPQQAGVLSLDLKGVHPHDVSTILDRHDVCVRAGHHCAMPLMHRLDVPGTTRASFYLYTTREEIDRLVVALHDAKRIFS
ncbi:MAG TPA: cysteine desulfurase [Candidatus Dormibacteraeota bacterium]|nr:cysteine desulfurase [Candidatus Dormibacteraeota bacterium]